MKIFGFTNLSSDEHVMVIFKFAYHQNILEPLAVEDMK